MVRTKIIDIPTRPSRTATLWAALVGAAKAGKGLEVTTNEVPMANIRGALSSMRSRLAKSCTMHTQKVDQQTIRVWLTGLKAKA